MRALPGLMPTLLVLTLLLTVPAAAEGPSSRTSVSNPFLAAVGVLLMAGGGALAWQQDREADRDMARYRQSAFTGNTELFRENVQEHEVRAWVGLAGAALGGILVVVSF